LKPLNDRSSNLTRILQALAFISSFSHVSNAAVSLGCSEGMIVPRQF
jgi:hypothetical protein